jgi:methanogenic corrinoid protein MtbC1
MLEVITQSLADLDENAVLEQVQQQLDSGTEAMQIFEACRLGMVKIGDLYEDKKYYISELMMAGEIFKGALAILTPAMQGLTAETRGQIVLGTVQGDIHDIGKDLVVSLLRANGFEVHDLGVDVAPDKFIACLQETGARVLGLSGLITTAFDGMRATMSALEAADLRKEVTVLIGGGMVNDEVMAYTGADAWGKDANQAIALCNQFVVV